MAYVILPTGIEDERMAYIVNPFEQQQQGIMQEVVAPPVTTGAISAPAPTTIPTGGGAPSGIGIPGRAPTRSGLFTNLQQYLEANAPQAQVGAQRIAGRIGEQAQQAREAVAKTTGEVQQQIQAGTQQYNPQLVAAAIERPTEYLQSPELQAQLAGRYAGPTEVTSLVQPAAEQVAKATALSQLAGTPEGRMELLRQTSARPYARGILGLEQLLIQGTPAIETVQQAAAQVQPIGTEFAQSQEQLQQAAEQGRVVSQATGEQARKEIAGATTAFEKDIQQRVAEERAQELEREKALRDVLGGAIAPSAQLPVVKEQQLRIEKRAPGVLGGQYLVNYQGQTYPLNQAQVDKLVSSGAAYVWGAPGYKTVTTPAVYGNVGSGRGTTWGVVTPATTQQVATGPAQVLQGKIAPSLSQAQADLAQKLLEAGTVLDDQTLQQIGISRDQWNNLLGMQSQAKAYGGTINLADYLRVQATPEAAITTGTVATPEEQARYGALRQLIGEQAGGFFTEPLFAGPRVALDPAAASQALQGMIQSGMARKQAAGAQQQLIAGQQAAAEQMKSAMETQGTMMGVSAGASMGAAIGSVVPGIGTVLGAVVGGIFGGIFCYAAGTQIIMADGTCKNIEDIGIGDNVLLGGLVLGAGAVLSDNMYLYHNTIVDGQHAVFEETKLGYKWIRVQDSEQATKLDMGQPGYQVVYPLVTQYHLVVPNSDYISADLMEVDNSTRYNDTQRLQLLNDNKDRNVALTELVQQYQHERLINEGKKIQTGRLSNDHQMV